MFDTNKVASNIKTARTNMNMTQMNLADEMGVSYQAVSNWKRGNSMPDISKLPELCKILNISFEELVGEKTKETEIVEKLMRDESADVTLEEMVQVGQLVKPDKIEKKVNETIEKGGGIPFSVIVTLAPFIERKTMDEIVDKCIQADNVAVGSIAAIAPFLSKSTLQKIAEYMIAHGQAQKLVVIAPFMGKEMLSNQFNNIKFDEWGSWKDSSGMNAVDLDELDEDEVAKLAFEAFEKENDVEEYLDYMDEEDVEKLAIKALEAGKAIECYLDYLDEDAIKSLLLKVVKK